MTCITHCGEDVNYQRHEFPHGEYLIPLNNDGTIHRCSVLRGGEDEILVIHNEVISEIGELYGTLLYEIQMIDFPSSTIMHYNLKNEKVHEHYTENDVQYQMIIEFLKKLFLINHICPDPFLEEPPNHYPVMYGAAAIIGLIGLLYYEIGDDNSHKKARELEKQINLSALMYDSVKQDNSSLEELWKKVGDRTDGITNEMTIEKMKEILENQVKGILNNSNSDETNLEEIDLEETEINDKDDEKFSLKNLEKYAKKVEDEVKSFLRTRISELEIKKYYRYCYNNAISNRETNPGYLKRDFDDVIEFLNFGNAVSILKGKIDSEIKDRSILFHDASHLVFHIPKKYFDFLYLILPFRNDDSHYTQEKKNNSMHLYERQMIYLAYIRLMDLFESLKNA